MTAPDPQLYVAKSWDDIFTLWNDDPNGSPTFFDPKGTGKYEDFTEDAKRILRANWTSHIYVSSTYGVGKDNPYAPQVTCT